MPLKFPKVEPGATRIDLDAVQLSMLLDGIDFGRVRRRPTARKSRGRSATASTVVTGPDAFQLIGSKTSTVYTMRPAKLIKRIYTRDTRACHCGKTIVSAPAPERFGRSQYDASVVAQLVTGKCSDSLPVARQAEQLRRQGVPASRATLNRLFLQAGRVLSPIALRILSLIAESDIVLGDETPIRQQDQDSKGYFWTFGNGDLVAYVYSSSS